MYSALTQKLGLALEPVAVSFTNEKPADAIQFAEGKRGCVAVMLLAAAKGKTAVFDEKTYGCPGGGVGLCFGDAFGENFPVECLLSTGDKALSELGKKSPMSFGKGERFFANPELVNKWRGSLPFAETPETYVVFQPLSRADESVPPDLIVIFANPDQISALVIMAGFNRGEAINVLAPFSAACQSIVFAYQEIAQEYPKAILGFFDLAQRHHVPKDILSMTVPLALYREMESSLGESCLTTEAWEKIAGR